MEFHNKMLGMTQSLHAEAVLFSMRQKKKSRISWSVLVIMHGFLCLIQINLLVGMTFITFCLKGPKTYTDINYNN